MRHVGERAKLSFEAIDVGGLCACQRFEGDDLVHFAVVCFVHDAHAARAQPPAQSESLCSNKLFGGLNHPGNLDDLTGQLHEHVDRYAIVPYMICAINIKLAGEGRNMDWRVMLTTFGVIFLAEMGDKTQLAAMTMAAQKKRPWEVFIAASLALAAVSAIGVVVGSALGQYLPLEWIKRGAGVAFIIIGILVLTGKFLTRHLRHA